MRPQAAVQRLGPVLEPVLFHPGVAATYAKPSVKLLTGFSPDRGRRICVGGFSLECLCQMRPASGGLFLLVSVAYGIVQLLAVLLSHENMADVRLSPNANSDLERLCVILACGKILLASGFLSLLCSSAVFIDTPILAAY